MLTTAWSFVAIHAALCVGLYFLWANSDERLPLSPLWWSMHGFAAFQVALFVRYPTRLSRALAGAISTVSFSGRAVAYVWIMVFDRDHPLLDRLGARSYVAMAGWVVMAVMAELLWWWLSGYRSEDTG